MIRKLRRFLPIRYLKSSFQIILACLLFGLACVLIEYRLEFVGFSLVSRNLNNDKNIIQITDTSVIRQNLQQNASLVHLTKNNNVTETLKTNNNNTLNIKNVHEIVDKESLSNESTRTILQPFPTSTTKVFTSEITSTTTQTNLTLQSKDPVEVIEISDQINEVKTTTSDAEKEKKEFMARMDLRMEQRRKHLKSTCQKLGINTANIPYEPWNRTLPAPRPWFYHSKDYPLIFCEVPKSGCSNWKKVLMVLNGLTNSTEGIKQGEAHAAKIGMVRSSPSNLLREIYEKSLKMMVVREPFERLVSAYQDKVAPKEPSKQAIFGRFSNEVAKKYGNRWTDPTTVDLYRTRSIVTCDQEEATLECTQPYHVIEIESASYGRDNGKICVPPRAPPMINTTTCWSTHSHHITSQICNGKAKCRVVASQVQFGQVASCSSIPKYLTIRYKCISISHMTSVTVCHLKQQTITCPKGSLISIGSAFFGRTNTKTCLNTGAIYNINCKSDTASAVVSVACNLRPNCTVESSAHWIQSQDCPATSKYLTIWYECKPQVQKQSQVLPKHFEKEADTHITRKLLAIDNTTFPKPKTQININSVKINEIKKPLKLNEFDFPASFNMTKLPLGVMDKIGYGKMGNKNLKHKTKERRKFEELPQPKIYKPPPYVPRRFPVQATFDEFSSYIVDPANSDVTKDSIDHGNEGLKSTSVRHWQHHSTLCHPCYINYDVIAHVETLTEDARYILERIGAPKDLEYPGGYDSGKRATDRAKVLAQLSKLSLEKIHKLYEFYKDDFQLFDFPIPQLLSALDDQHE